MTLREQFVSLLAAGVDSVMLSWWGQRNKSVHRDSQGVNTDLLIPAVLDVAAETGMKVSWHLEPYGGRSPLSVLDDLRYIYKEYGRHQAIWRHGTSHLPLIFLYDVSMEHSGATVVEQQSAMRDWKEAIQQVRSRPEDAILLSLYHDERDVDFVLNAGFDGAYTYFAVRLP